MNAKIVFTRFVFFIFTAMLASGILIPIRYNFSYPAKLGPEFDAGIRAEQLGKINRAKPDLILIGDSILEEGVDSTLLSNELGISSYKAAIPGSGTASWYLFMKNIVFEAKHRPEYVIILFRVTMLTVPQYRTTGKYFFLLDDYAYKNESLVAELAFINQMNPFEKFAEQYIPIYTTRVKIREDLDNALRYPAASILAGCNRECTDNAVGSIFGREVDPVALNLAQEDAAKTLYASEEMDFESQIETSLLPHIIELAQKNNTTLILVRTKVYGPETKELAKYTLLLDNYLAQQESVILLDFANDPRVLESYYIDSLHMNANGRREFTIMLAEEIKPLIQK